MGASPAQPFSSFTPSSLSEEESCKAGTEPKGSGAVGQGEVGVSGQCRLAGFTGNTLRWHSAGGRRRGRGQGSSLSPLPSVPTRLWEHLCPCQGGGQRV